MNQQPTYNPLELLRRWIQGDTPLEEERQLEQLAEDDPFLAEALEGYRRHPEGRHAEQVEQLKVRVQEKGKKRRGLLFYLPRAAAAAVLLAVAAGGFWFINREDGAMAPLAVQEKQVEDTGAAAMESDKKRIPSPTPSGEAEEKEALPITESEKKRNEAHAEPPTTSRPPKPGRQRIPDAPPSQNAPNSKETELAQTAPLPTQPKELQPEPAADNIQLYDLQEEALQEKPESGAIARAAPAEPANESATLAPRNQSAVPAPPKARTVTGAVTGPGGDPLVGASVLVEGTQRGATTNFDGQFTLQLPEGAGTHLIVDYVGYQSQRLELGEEDSLAIVLPEGDALLESVVVTGYDTGREAPLPAPQPKNGFDELRQYIRDNLQYPESARQKGIKGKVKLTFRIQPDGTPGKFKIEKGLSDACNEEAIRLLKEGPKWEGAGQEAKYTIRFKL